MYNKNEIDEQAEREGSALKRQERYTQSRYHWIRLQDADAYRRNIEKKAFKGK